ncbi:hypothetical protein LINPERPRIM_LOCUS14879, partial [Linum perenne]
MVPGSPNPEKSSAVSGASLTDSSRHSVNSLASLFRSISWRLLEVVSELEPWGADSVCGVVSAVMSVLDLRQMFLCFLETCFQLSFAQVFRAQLS